MANYQLGPVIGQLGGAEVQKIPVNISVGGGPGAEAIMHTVHVPEGETWLIALIGDLNPGSASLSYSPEISIGEVISVDQLPAGRTWIAAEVTGTAEITLRRQTATRTDDFVGHVYTAPLP